MSATAPAAAATGHMPAATPARRRVLHAALWLLGSNVSSQALRLLSNLVLARWLAPDAFGLIAAAHAAYFALVMFSDLGIWQGIVRSPRGTDPRMLGTAWSVQLLRSLLLAGGIALLAMAAHRAAMAGLLPPGTVYADPRLPWILAVFALCALVQGTESVNLACAQRDLRGRELAALELQTQLVAMSVTLCLAWATRSPMALAAGSLAAALARSALSHRVIAGPPVRPAWDHGCLAEIVGFGKWTFLSSIIGFAAAHGEKLILGGLLASASFGVFTIASLLVAALAGVFGSVNGQVVFSRLSQATRHGWAEARQVYLRAQRVADAALGLLAGLLATAGHWIVVALYDARYQDAGWMLRWLALGLVALRQQVVEQLMFALGRPQGVMVHNLLRALALAALVPLGHAAAGERGAVAAVVLSQFAGWPASWRFRRTNGLLAWPSELAWLAALGAGALLGCCVDALLHHVLRG